MIRVKSIKKIKGFSLIELLMAVAIIVMVLLSVSLLTTKSIQMATFSQDNQKATSYAKEGIELVRFDRDTQTWDVFSSLDYPDADYQPSDSRFSRQIVITDGSGGAFDENDLTAKVSITVSWTDSKGLHSVSQKTVLTKRP